MSKYEKLRRKESEKTEFRSLDSISLQRVCRLIECSKLEEQPIVIRFVNSGRVRESIGHVVGIDLVKRMLLICNGEFQEAISFTAIVGADKLP